MYHRTRFLDLVGQTSHTPQGFEISRAEGSWLYDQNGVAYLDLISGFGVSNLGHAHPTIVEAIQVQSKLYLHTNVYGEHVQNPQNQLASLLRSILPSSLHQIYFLSTGSEVIDAAIKLARSYTGRVEIVVLYHSYHGSTMAAESLRSDRAHSSHFLPLIPGVRFIHANDFEGLEKISDRTALVLIEPIQAEAGVIAMEVSWLKALQLKCNVHGVLLAFDEIQTGFGRTGSMFAFQNLNVIPDLLLLGKALGGGLPLAALVSRGELLASLAQLPALGYITTFGGNPLCCAAGGAHLKAMLQEEVLEGISIRSNLIRSILQNPRIKEIRIKGLFAAIEFENEKLVHSIVKKAREGHILLDSFLFRPSALRIAPPLNIPIEILEDACQRINLWIEEIRR